MSENATEIYRIKTNQEALINGTEDLIWSVDKDFRIITSNKAYGEMIKMVTGRIPQEGDFVMTKEFGEELNKKWEIYYQRALNGERYEVKEQVFHLLRQRMEYTVISFNPMFNERGELFGAACYSKDITAETNYLKALEKTKAELETIMDSSLDMICAVDANGIILSISAACKTILDYTPEELIGKHLFDYLYPEDKKATEQMARRIMRGVDMTYFENRYVRKDGSLVPLFWSARWDSERRIRYGVARDATEQKKKDAILIESERKYRELFESNPLPLFLWDYKTFGFIDCNNAAVTKYGYSRNEFLKMTIRDLWPADAPATVENPIHESHLDGKIFNRIRQHRKKNGDLMHVEVSGQFINYEGKRVVLAMANDITDRQYYQELDKLERNVLEFNEKSNQSLAEVTMIYLSGIETLHPGMLCSIQEKRGDRLFNLISPTLPEKFLEAIEGEEIGDNKGSCGSAAFLKQQVIVTDISNDARWADYKGLAAQYQLKSCWSYPILDGKNNVIATFACYYREIKTPSKQEENTIHRAGNILQIILEGYKRARDLEISNERFEYVTKATSDIIWDWSLETNEVYYSDNMQKLFGHTPGINGNNLPFYFEHVHPDDRERVVLYPDQVKYSNITHWTQEYRFRKADGNYAFVMDKGIVIRDEKGLGIRMVGAMQDITSRKEEEHRLKLLESVITHTNDSILITEAEPFDEPGPRIVYVNNAFTQMTGYTAEEVIGKSPRLLQGPKTDKQELKRLKECMQKWQPFEMTIVNYKKNGEEFWLNFSITPVADEKGWFTHWISIERDVTERKMTEAALEAAYIEKNTILESIGDAFFAVDNNWMVTYWNNHAEKVLMIAKNEIIGKPLWDVFPDSIDSESYKKYHEALETNEVIRFEDYYKTFNTWYEISAYPSMSGLSVYFKDITERKLINQRLSEERNLLRTLIDNLPHSVYFKDKFARKLISNKVDYELLGFTTEDKVLGKTDLQVLPAEIAALAYEQDSLILKSGKALINYEHYYTTADGTWLAISTSKIPLFDVRNEVIGLLGIGRDITEQKLAEKKLMELNAELERNVKQLTISNTELEQFAYVASHDLQEPLRMITSFMAQLEKKYGDVVDEKGRQYIHFAVDGAKRMRQIILDLLDFSRVGSTGDDKEELDFNKLMNEILALHRRQIEESDAIVRFENLPVFYIYKAPVRQVFQNLVSNSLKYHRKGVAPVINISCNETKTHYQFSVKDNGLGIAPEYFEKIFIIFQRLHNKDEYSGTGMGLAITKKIVENLGGKIWLESEEGKGSTFYFTILKK